MMRFYAGQHRYFCGVDLHTKRMYLCILDREGIKRLHRNVRAKPQDFLNAIEGFRDDLVVGVECMFTWYWLADLCLNESIKFLLGHALYMKAIHGGKKKDDKLDSEKIARLMRGGTFPLAMGVKKSCPPSRHPIEITDRASSRPGFCGPVVSAVPSRPGAALSNLEERQPRTARRRLPADSGLGV